MITFNNIVSKFEEFVENHYFLKTFSYGSPADVDLDKFEQYPLLHLVYTGGDFNSPKAKTYNLEVYILTLPPSDADKVEYQKESISNAEQVAEDILADIQNGGNIFQFGYKYDLVNASVTPLEEEKSNALAGCLLDIAISVPYTYDSCNAPLTGVEPEGSTTPSYKARGLLRMRELDGSPDVLSVATINVPNGSLVDDGNGEVTLTFGAGGAVDSVTGGTGLTATPTTGDVVVSLDDTAVTPGSYTTADITVDAQGRITSASSGTATNASRLVQTVKNVSGGELAKGTPVHAVLDGAEGNLAYVIAARADTASAMPATFVLNETLADEAEGEAIITGLLQGVDTDLFQPGDVVYVGATGGYTNVKPTGTNLIQNLGIVLKSHPSNGSGIVYGSGRANDVPNIPEGYGWLGNASGVATPTLFNFYLNRFDATASTMASTLDAGTATIERIDTARWTGTGVYLSQQSDTPSAGNAIKRKVYYKDEFGSTDAFGTWTLIHEFADDTSYSDALTYINDTIIAGQTNGTAPASLVMTWEDVPGFTGLLDDYPGAAAAYSLRLLDTTYTGSAIRVRRASDNQETDIGFNVFGELDTVSLAAHCGSNDGFVKTWYDQSGSANDATQTATTQQPKIYDGSTGVVTENGKPAVQFDGSNDFMKSGDYIVELSQNSASVFSVSQTSTLSQDNYILSEGDSASPYSSQFIMGGGGVSNGTDILWVNATTFGTMQTGQRSIGFDYNQTSFTTFIDGSQSGSAASATVNSEASIYSYIGSRADGTTAFFTGKIQELITYKSDQSTNRSGIETNINSFYDIYP